VSVAGDGRDPRRNPWRRAPVGELQEQLLPRWFVLLALAMIPVAAVVVVAAFILGGAREVPVVERRPPPAAGLTHAVGQLQVGEAAPEPYAEACPLLQGVQVAGTDADRALLRRGLAGVCNTTLDEATAAHLRAFAGAGGVVRFALFEATGVDSAARGGNPPAILVNAKFTQTDPLWISPLVVHDATMLGLDATLATSAVAAREAELRVCERLLSGRRASRGCADAASLLALPHPLAALRDAGYR
jgi:hypothetical protein